MGLLSVRAHRARFRRLLYPFRLSFVSEDPGEMWTNPETRCKRSYDQDSENRDGGIPAFRTAWGRRSEGKRRIQISFLDDLPRDRCATAAAEFIGFEDLSVALPAGHGNVSHRVCDLFRE